jgi:secreted trypsin-like serine protease
MRAALLVLAQAASAHASPPVVGGTPAPPNTWPDAVAVIGQTGTCSGTLIGSDMVLTAGHCSEIEPVRIVADTIDFTRGGVEVDVAQTIVHPDWTSMNDAALLVLATPVPGVAPRAIGAACTFDAFTAGSPVELVGFGRTNAGANTLLQQASVPVTDPACTDGNGCRASIAPGGEFVAGGDGVDTCNGDSGGPVYFATPRGEVVVGVVSRGLADTDGACGGGGIYERTDKLVAWLDSIGDVAIDDCGSAAPVDDPAPVGCNVTHGDASLLVALLLVRRRRPRAGHARPSPGQPAR